MLTLEVGERVLLPLLPSEPNLRSDGLLRPNRDEPFFSLTELELSPGWVDLRAILSM